MVYDYSLVCMASRPAGYLLDVKLQSGVWASIANAISGVVALLFILC